MFTASKSTLLDALKLVAQVVERRNTMPILQNVLFFRQDGGELAARVTDLDIEAVIPFRAEVLPAFRPMTMPAHLLHEIVRKLPDGADIRFEPDAEMRNAIVRSGRSRFSLPMLPAEDFPTMGAGELPFGFDLPAASLASAIAGVSFAISTEETRYYLNGIYCHAIEPGIRMVATDGHRLSKRFIPLDGAPVSMPGVIIPKKTVDVLARQLPKDGSVRVDVSDAKIRFAFADMVLVSKLIDGTYPEYQRVIPERDRYIEIDAKPFAAAVDRVSTLASGSRAVSMALENGAMSLIVNNPDSGRAEEEVSYEGMINLTIGFNAKYVNDAISHLPEGTIRVGLEDPGSPAIFRADGDHEENLIVLMPMRV